MLEIKVCIIYLLTNKINNKVYVGQTWQSLKERFGNGHGYKACIHLYNAIKKYGWDNFEHRKLTIALSQKDANEAEDFFMHLYKSRDRYFGYNIRGGGSTGKLSAETKQKLSILNAGENNNFFGKTHTIEARQKISQNTIMYHKAGSYDNKCEEQRRFSAEEEKNIIAIYIKGDISIQELLKRFNFSYSTFDRMKQRHHIETILQPKSEDHLERMRENMKIALPFRLKNAEEQTLKMMKTAVKLREQGLLQKEIAKIMGITQVRISQLLIKAGMRTKPLIIDQKKSSKSNSNS